MSKLTVAQVKAFAALHKSCSETIAEIEQAIDTDAGQFVYCWPDVALGVAYGQSPTGRTAPVVVSIHRARIVGHNEDGLEFKNGNGSVAEFMPRIKALHIALDRACDHLGVLENAIGRYEAPEPVAK
jgi:hypothetical protein